MTLDKTPKRQPVRISGFDSDSSNRILIDSLRDIGMAEGDHVEITETGPIGKTPMSLRIGANTIAIRRSEAALVHVVRN